jgi:uncharacterized YccA/Bax inhibitor family protein
MKEKHNFISLQTNKKQQNNKQTKQKKPTKTTTATKNKNKISTTKTFTVVCNKHGFKIVIILKICVFTWKYLNNPFQL